MVYYNFEISNQNQKPGGTLPMPYATNYEIKIYGGSDWLNASAPKFVKEFGDFETALTWLGSDYVQSGYTMLGVKATQFNDTPIENLGQIFTFNIQVLTQTDFMKAAKALNLDLSSYNCIHPNK